MTSEMHDQTHESFLAGARRSIPDNSNVADMRLYEEPLRIIETSGPKMLLNGFPIDDWDAILVEDQHKKETLETGHQGHYSSVFGIPSRKAMNKSLSLTLPMDTLSTPIIDLRRKSYADVNHSGRPFNPHETCQHSGIARNWPTSRKRFAAFVACLNTSCIGLLLGIYAGETPAIQYALADFNHYTILGNVFMYAGLAISTVVFWPLPLLHGRKPYVIAAGLIGLVLQVPQGLAVAGFRDPSTVTYKALLLASRAFSGFVLGFSDLNQKAILLDCFGASLQSSIRNQQIADVHDARKHGGGIGIWLGFLSWSTIGPISIGFMVGASIINRDATVAWGFWISLIALLLVSLFNVIAPETRRSAFRRTVAELIGQDGDFSRIGRGEIKMHLDSIGPVWWGEELMAGFRLSGKMLLQPGFLVLSFYMAWVYAQYNLVVLLIGALASKNYRYHAVWVGLCALAPALGALVAAPFQRASCFSRSRSTPVRTDSHTMRARSTWSSHLVRRVLFMILLPVSAAAFAGSSIGPPLIVAIPCIMAGLVGFFTTMATAECYSLIMEAFDTSDLQPGMTGRPIRSSDDLQAAQQRTNFSCYPRISAGLALSSGMSFVLAACATLVAGIVQRKEGTFWATTGVAIISMGLTLTLTLVLAKWKKVQMIPDGQETLVHIRRVKTNWRPVIVGHPSGKFRRLSIFEMGRLTRYSQIRKRNRIEQGLSRTNGS